MPRLLLLFCCLAILWIVPACAEPVPSAPVLKAPSTTATPLSSAGDDQLTNQILQLLDGATITRLDAKVSLESLSVQDGQAELRGLRLQNFELGLRLKPKAAKRLFDLAKQYMPANGQNAQPAFSAFDILKLGVYSNIEFGIHLDELSIGLLKVRAEELEVKGLVLRAGAAPPPEDEAPRAAILRILRRAILNQVEVHAGLEKFASRHIEAKVQKVALLGLRVGLSLQRAE